MSTMAQVQDGFTGNVYILEVKDLDLPVCKIGMTKKDPMVRCAEINKSSTGDFLWSVRYVLAVDDCIRFESLIHRTLERYRQKGREFFQLTADEAYGHAKTMLAQQSDIKEIPAPSIPPATLAKRTKDNIRRPIGMKGDEEYAPILYSFVSRLGVKGRPFGQVGKPHFGLSDGYKGVQWNIAIDRDPREIYLGVNLEGMKYSGWPIATFIQFEMARPNLEEIKAEIGNPDRILLILSRDAWQVHARPTIVEQHIGGRRHKLSEIDPALWLELLSEARECLDASKNFRGRSKQLVTVRTATDETPRMMDVSPHLTVQTKIDVDPKRDYDQATLNSAFDGAYAELKPIHDWVSRVAKSNSN
ncbi:GIY-YIG nuclease family protein [Bradyrhizobium rifense]|uniref:GIY-YIG nuclease family protein n=2 Tax=Bradyrhizobium rifense TaxID=515499 RepID=A0A5D3K3R0_9BRAD|nr:GIY-YIG nuclease family protein [Bradyrhizobium rifense]